MIDILDNEVYVLMENLESIDTMVFVHLISNPYDYKTEILADFFDYLLETRTMDSIKKVIVYDFFLEFDCFDVYIFLQEEKSEKGREKSEMDFESRYLRDQELKYRLDAVYDKKFLQELFYHAGSKDKSLSNLETMIVRFCYKSKKFLVHFEEEKKIFTQPYNGTRDITIRMIKYVLF